LTASIVFDAEMDTELVRTFLEIAPAGDWSSSISWTALSGRIPTGRGAAALAMACAVRAVRLRGIGQRDRIDLRLEALLLQDIHAIPKECPDAFRCSRMAAAPL
jgi:hypothetical protein